MEITVKDSAGKVYEGATVALEGQDANGEAVSLSEATDNQGVASFTGVKEGSYTATASGTGSADGKNYTLTASGKAPAVAVTGGVDAATASVTVTAEEVTNAYPFSIQVTDRLGNALDIQEAAISFGGSSVTKGTWANGTLAVTTGVSATKELVVKGLAGYQPISAQLTLTPDGTDKTDTLSLAELNQADAKVTGNKTDGFVVSIKASKTVTNVTLPVPVPTLGGSAAAAADLAGMPGEQALKAELAPRGSVTLAVEDGITLTGADTVTGVTARAGLPDGYYQMTIGGAGIDAKSVRVTVLNGTVSGAATTVVNVGGEHAADGTVTGGVTGTVEASKDADGNAAIDLSPSGGAAMKESADGTVSSSNGTITISEGTAASEVTDLTQSDTAQKEMATVVATDPVYQVVIAEAAAGSTAQAPVYEGKIYLKNAVAAAGTFGMYFDPAIINLSGKSFDNAVKVNAEAGITIPANTRQFHVPGTKEESGYLTFDWYTGSGQDAVDATRGGVLLATVQLPIDTTAEVVNNLDTLFSNTTVYTMEYEATEKGKKIVEDLVKDGYVPGDEDFQEMYNQSMGGIWRPLELAGQGNSVHLEGDKATRGGFYQITVEKNIGTPEAPMPVPVSSDIRMEFVLPQAFKGIRADFHVTDTVGQDIEKATVTVYQDSDGFDIDSAEAAGSKTTNSSGRTYFTLKPGTYHYTVEHPSFWAYPDGTVNTDNADNPRYDTFTVDGEGSITLTGQAKPGVDGAWTATDYLGEYISPVMDAMSYHKVLLDGAAGKATLSGLTKAYNGVDYAFTIQPAAGYGWSVGEGKDYADMAAVAAKLTAKLFDPAANAGAAKPEEMYQTGAGTALANAITWDNTRNKFVIAGGKIDGGAVGDVSFPDGAPDWFESLRSGDIQVGVQADMLVATDRTLTITAGTGGTVSVALDESLGDTNTDATAQSNQTALTETLKNGRTTSSVYTFTADAGNTIEQVIINGVKRPLTEEQKKHDFVYQFTNVSGNESITVTFQNGKGEAVSAPVLTVTAGSHGTAQVTGKDDPAWAGLNTKTYQMAVDTAASVVLTPASDYQFDVVEVDGIARTDLTADGSGYYTGPYTVSFAAGDMAAGKNHTVTVTFKQAKANAPSLEAIVTAQVEQGFGSLAPIGVSIHSVGDTPSFVLTPVPGWTVNNTAGGGAILVGDGRADASEYVALDTDTGSYTYTMDPLTGDTPLAAVFAEQGYQVKGIVKTVYGSQPTKAAATLTFTRNAVEGQTDKTTYTYTTDQTSPDSGVSAVDENGNMAFDIQVPAGIWTVTVSKPGYLDYVIRSFEVRAGAQHTIHFGDGTTDGVKPGATEADPGTATTEADIRPIVLVIGDAAGDGLSIYSDDIGVVASGWLKNAGEAAKRMGDVNESNLGGGSDSTDMSQLLNNYGKLRIRQEYQAFCSPAP